MSVIVSLLFPFTTSEDKNAVLAQPVIRPDDFFTVKIEHRKSSNVNATSSIVNSCKKMVTFTVVFQSAVETVDQIW